MYTIGNRLQGTEREVEKQETTAVIQKRLYEAEAAVDIIKSWILEISGCSAESIF